MVWVRYDDEFHHHDKVMEARDADPGSLALHLLGNTWTASSKTPGWIPNYVPRQLAGAKAKKWAQILVDARLWDAGELDGKPGWWVHDFDTYNPVDEATKKRRSDSARKAANARWHPETDAGTHADGNAERMRDASGENAATMPSDAIARGRPVPVPSNSPTSKGSPTVPAGAVPRIVRSYVTACRDAGIAAPEEAQARVERSARSLIAQGYPLGDIETAARNAAAGGWTDLATQLQRDTSRASPPPGGRPSTTDRAFTDALQLATNLDRKALG